MEWGELTLRLKFHFGLLHGTREFEWHLPTRHHLINHQDLMAWHSRYSILATDPSPPELPNH